MKTLSQTIVDSVWEQIVLGATYGTPNALNEKSFEILERTESIIRVCTRGGKKLKIQKESFRLAIVFLILHGRISKLLVEEIKSSNTNPGPLDLTTRQPQSSKATRVVNYILPILENAGILSINQTIPNSCFLNI